MANKSSQVKIAVLVLAALGLIIFGVKYLTGSKLFSNDKQYFSEFTSAKGIGAGDKVVLLGVDVGNVTSVDFIDNYQKVKVGYTIQDNIQLPQDTKISIDGGIPGFGSPALKLLLGKSNQYLPANSLVATEQTFGMTDKAAQLVDQVEPTVQNLNSAISRLDSVAISVNGLLSGENGRNIEHSLASLNSTLANFNTSSSKLTGIIDRQGAGIESTLGNLNSLSNTLASNQAKIDLIVNNLVATSNNVAQLDLAKTQGILNETILSAKNTLGGVDTALSGAGGTMNSLETTMANANVTLTKLNSILSQVENGDGTLSLLLNNAELYNNLNDTSRDLDRLILDLQEQPRKYVPGVSVFGGGKKKRNKSK